MHPDIILNINLTKPVVDVTECEGIVVKDLMVRNFWRLFIGVHTATDVTLTDIDGYTYPTMISRGVLGGPAVLRFGTSTTPPDWAHHAILSGLGTGEGSMIHITNYIEGNTSVVEFARQVTSSAVREIAIYGDTHRYSHPAVALKTTMYGRAVLTSPPPLGSLIRYKVIFRPPLTANLARIWKGIFAYEAGSGVIDESGSIYSIRGFACPCAGASYLAVGVGDKPFEPTDYCLTTPIYLSCAYDTVHAGSYSLLSIGGFSRLESNVAIREIGLFQDMFDSGVGARRTLLMRYVLPRPLTKKAGEVVLIIVNIYASA